MANDRDEREPQGADELGRGDSSTGRHGYGAYSRGGAHSSIHEEHREGAPEWLISFADNVTLLMGFFVILLALNLRPATTGRGSGGGQGTGEGPAEAISPALLDWTIGIRAAFNNPVDVHSTDPRDQLLVQRLMARAGRGQASEPGPKGREEETQTVRPSDYVGVGGVVSFEQGGNELSPTAAAAAQEIARHLRGFRSVVEVRGHVSAAEAHRLDRGGVALSYERARVVAEALAAEGVEWKRLRVIACGAAEPLTVPAYDDDGQRSNQRVEVIVTDRTVQETSQPATDPLPPAK